MDLVLDFVPRNPAPDHLPIRYFPDGEVEWQLPEQFPWAHERAGSKDFWAIFERAVEMIVEAEVRRVFEPQSPLSPRPDRLHSSPEVEQMRRAVERQVLDWHMRQWAQDPDLDPQAIARVAQRIEIERAFTVRSQIR